MTEPTVRLGAGEHLTRLSLMAEDLRGQLESFRSRLGPSQPEFPRGVLQALRQLGGTLQSLRTAVEDMERERTSLAALADVGRVVNSSLDLPTVLVQVIDTLIRITGAERAFLMLGKADALKVSVARNWERSAISPGEEAFSRTVVERVARSSEPVLTTNAQADARFAGKDSIIAHNLRSILCVPMKVKGELIGVIYADNRVREGLFSDKDRSLLAAFADQAAVAIENARLFGDVARLKTQMDDVFASIVSGVIASDIEDRISTCNQAAAGILARQKSDLVGSPLEALLPLLAPDLSPRIAEVRHLEKPLVRYEIHTDIEGRGRVDLSLSATPLRTSSDVVQGVTLVMEDLTETRRLEATRRLFKRMVSPAVIEQLDPDRIQLGGRVEEITTLFADLQGFTALGETVDPETLVSVLNRYLASAAEAILAEEGTIDKFLGDAIMAWFNAPMPQPDHRLRAARAALGIRRAAAGLREEMPEQFRLSYRVGVHTGPALLGLVGTESRVEYTAIGDSVNTAKRLQENAAVGQILLSREAAGPILDELDAEEGAPVQVQGKRAPLAVWELKGLRVRTPRM
jgi:class 3 adenylate cyclase/GAF domain-containing protein